MSIENLTTFFGWCTVINIGLLAFSTVVMLAANKPISRMHAKLFSLDEGVLQQAYFQYLAQFKIVTLTLNLTPYIALKVMMMGSG